MMKVAWEWVCDVCGLSILCRNEDEPAGWTRPYFEDQEVGHQLGEVCPGCSALASVQAAVSEHEGDVL